MSLARLVQKTSVLRTPKLGNQKSVFMGLSEGAFGRVFLTLLASYTANRDIILIRTSIV